MSKVLGICGALAFAFVIGLAGPAGARPGTKCGGFIINPGICGENEFCQRRAGQCFNFDVGGTCTVKPLRCPLRRGVFYIPQCGCNGVTYANDCLRRQAGVSLAHVGKCT